MENPIGKLDIALKWFVENPSILENAASLSASIHMDNYFFKEKINADALSILIEKLFRDGYLMAGNISPAEIGYKISFNGLLFYQQKGYKRKELEKELQLEAKKGEIILSEQDRKRQDELTATLKTYQKWVVIGTLVAAAYYLIEIIKWVLHFFA